MSLRLRLLLIVVVLAGGVLVAVNVVTYTSLRSFLVDRDREELLQSVGGVDRQLEAAATVGDRRLGADGCCANGIRRRPTTWTCQTRTTGPGTASATSTTSSTAAVARCWMT